MLTMERDAADRMRAFGAALAEALSARSVTQAQLGEQLGITQSSISAWKSGTAKPEPETVFEVERLLDLTPGHLSRHLGYWPEPSETRAMTFEEAIRADDLLDDDVKEALIRVYQAARPKRRRR